MWANFKAQFTIDGTNVRLDRIDIDTDGAETVADGGVDFGHWPEQTYQVRSRVQFPRMRELFFAKEHWKLGRRRRLHRRVPPLQGRPRSSGNFTSEVAGVDDYRFPSLFGSLRLDAQLLRGDRRGLAASPAATRGSSFGITPLGSPDRPTARFDASYTDVDLARLSDFYELAGVRFAGTRDAAGTCSSGRSASSASIAATGRCARRRHRRART